ncbi:MAG: hypothetical protein L3J42_00130 [Hydrogenimonas sp.]|nr:hypothetical protein [Hydrogenimonas sp.]
MCEELVRFIKEELNPYLKRVRLAFESEGEYLRAAQIVELEETFAEILEDIDSRMMDEWECGELYEEFKRYRESGEFLDKIC